MTTTDDPTEPPAVENPDRDAHDSPFDCHDHLKYADVATIEESYAFHYAICPICGRRFRAEFSFDEMPEADEEAPRPPTEHDHDSPTDCRDAGTIDWNATAEPSGLYAHQHGECEECGRTFKNDYAYDQLVCLDEQDENEEPLVIQKR